MNKNPVKILHCLESIGSGGVEQRRVSLARYLDPAQFQQIVVCAKIKEDFDAKFQNYGVKVYPIGALRTPFNLAYYRKLFRIIRMYKPTIIHGAVFEGVISAVVGGLFCRVPIIIIEETSEPLNRSWKGNYLLKLLSIFANDVIAISPAVYHYLTNELNIGKNKVKLILNGAEPPAEPDSGIVESKKKAAGIEEGDFVVGFVGRLFDDHKRVSILIQAFAEFSKLNLPGQVKLLIVGDGPDRQMLQNLAEEYSIHESVIFAGYQSDTAPYYKLMDAFALVSQREGFGMVVVEAMFFGLPVIGTSVGGIKDIIVDGETGILVSVDNPKQISRSIQVLFENRQRAKQMGEAGKRRALNQFTAKRYAVEVQEIYNNHISSFG